MGERAAVCDKHQADPPGRDGQPLESTVDLLILVRSGDGAAIERLVLRYRPILRRWAHRRLPPAARSLSDTDDLVQICLLKALEHLDGFEWRRAGAFAAYLRRILLNQLRDEARKRWRQPALQPIVDEMEGNGPSPLDRILSKEDRMAYESALARLPRLQQEAIALRLEMGCTHQEVAIALGLPSANAARMMVSRALAVLAEQMDEKV